MEECQRFLLPESVLPTEGCAWQRRSRNNEIMLRYMIIHGHEGMHTVRPYTITMPLMLSVVSVILSEGFLPDRPEEKQHEKTTVIL